MDKYILVHGIRIASDYAEFVPETFGRLTTIGPIFWLSMGKRRHRWQTCVCDCGSVTAVMTGHIKGGHSQSCGCLQKENIQKLHDLKIKHFQCNTKEYRAWQALSSRCLNPKNSRYSSYGGRGIRVCDRWREPNCQGFLNFLADMGPAPSPLHSIDRHPNRNGNYEPGNVRWATNKQQCNNKTNNRLLTAFGKTQTITQWAEELGVSDGTLRSRVRYGWDDSKILSTPVRTIRREA